MQTVLIIYIFLLGTTLASFLNALMYRLDKEYKYPEIFLKPSHCEKCNKDLKWYDLIPVLSYIITKGKCSKCKTKINIYYPVSELFLGLSLSMFYYTQAPWYSYPILLLLFCLTYFDLEYKEIPSIPTIAFLLSGVLYLIIKSILSKSLLLNALPSGMILIVGITILLIVMYGLKNFKDGFGFGDFLILLSISMFENTKKFWIVFWITILISMLVSIIGFAFKKFNRKTALPLLPFITLGYVIANVFGETILEHLSKIMGVLY